MKNKNKNNSSSNNHLDRINALLIDKLEYLDDKTKEVLTSFENHVTNRGSLTMNQEKWFIKMEEEYSDENIAIMDEWEYGDEEKENATIAAHYNSAGRWHTDLSAKILIDYVPTYTEYRSLTENSYAKKVIEETKKTPRFAVGNLVQARATASLGYKNKPGMIVKIVNDPILVSARGAKEYMVKFYHGPLLTVQERWLKFQKGEKKGK
jgi:hypothetical protein